jgi:3-oxoadipate enol-lactonase
MMATQMIGGLAVEISGEGPAVLCIHGLGGSSNTWSPLMPALAGYRVIRMDLPGSARSELGGKPLSIAVYVDAVHQVMEALNVDQAIVLAHSMGTIVAQHYAVVHPSRIKALALFGPLVEPPEPGRAGARARAALARLGTVAMQEIADTIVGAATSKETRAGNPLAVTLVRESIMRQPAEGYAQSCEALADAQAASIESIAVPVLLVTGDQDGVAPVTAVHSMASRIAGSKVVVFEGCGHWTTFEKAAECATAISHFLK